MRLFIAFFSLLILFNCSKDRENENCRFLLDINVNTTINLNLPEYNQLQFSGNSVYLPNHGNNGIIIVRIGANYFAWDATDPNHAQNSCSRLVNSGLEATSICEDGNKFSLVNGQPLENSALECGLRNYRVEHNGNTLTIFN